MVTDRRRLPAGVTLPALARQVALLGAGAVQLREKDLGARALLELARDVEVALRGTGARLVVNGRPDVAVLAGAAGVQLPEDGLPVADVRRAFPGLQVGASCHGVESVRRAAAAGAHWAVLGPVFATPGKEARAMGLDALREACRSSPIPVHAVGGIDAASAAAVRGAGAAGLLAIRAFLSGDARGLKAALSADAASATGPR